MSSSIRNSSYIVHKTFVKITEWGKLFGLIVYTQSYIHLLYIYLYIWRTFWSYIIYSVIYKFDIYINIYCEVRYRQKAINLENIWRGHSTNTLKEICWKSSAFVCRRMWRSFLFRQVSSQFRRSFRYFSCQFIVVFVIFRKVSNQYIPESSPLFQG